MVSEKETACPSICLSLLLQALIPGWQLTCISSLDDGEYSRKLWRSRVLPSKAERNDVFSSTAESKNDIFEEVFKAEVT